MSPPIPYPLINGVRHSFASIVLKLDGQEFVGFSKVAYSRERKRSTVMGANPDPLGKTRGQNEHKFTLTVYFAEFYEFVTAHFGNGYGDAFFTTQLSINENGMAAQDVEAIGCTIDKNALDASQGPDGLSIDLELNPIKIRVNGVDDNATPLGGVAA